MLLARAGEAVAPQCIAAPSKQCMRPMSRTRDLKGRAQKGKYTETFFMEMQHLIL